MNKIILPRGYLSYSQLSLFERSPKEYAEIYFYGKKYPTSKYMEFGKNIHKELEREHNENDEEIITGLKCLLPKYKYSEYEIRTTLDNINLLGYLDTFQSRKFRDTKTGKIPWTQKKVDESDQIIFYALLIYLKYGKLPTKIHLDWIETKEEDGEIMITGNLKSFETKRTMVGILRMSERIQRSARKISILYKKEINKTLK